LHWSESVDDILDKIDARFAWRVSTSSEDRATSGTAVGSEEGEGIFVEKDIDRGLIRVVKWGNPNDRW